MWDQTNNQNNVINCIETKKCICNSTIDSDNTNIFFNSFQSKSIHQLKQFVTVYEIAY